MMSGQVLAEDSIAILDSSVLIAMGSPSTERYRAFEEHVTRRNVTARIPAHVATELGESPAAYAYQRDRLRAAQEAGWLEQASVDFSNPGVSETVDRTQTRMLNLSADDVTEDEIEKADTVLAGLAYQYAAAGRTPVTVLVSDAVAEQAIEDVLTPMDIGGAVAVIEGRTFLDTLVERRGI